MQTQGAAGIHRGETQDGKTRHQVKSTQRNNAIPVFRRCSEAHAVSLRVPPQTQPLAPAPPPSVPLWARRAGQGTPQCSGPAHMASGAAPAHKAMEHDAREAAGGSRHNGKRSSSSRQYAHHAAEGQWPYGARQVCCAIEMVPTRQSTRGATTVSLPPDNKAGACEHQRRCVLAIPRAFNGPV